MPSRDSFDAVVAIAPTQVKQVEVILTITDGTPPTYAARYTFDQLAADDSIVEVRAGDLSPALTAPQRTTMRGLMDAILTKAKGSV